MHRRQLTLEMYLKQKRNFVGVFAIYTITALTLHLGACEPRPTKQELHNGIKSVVNTESYIIPSDTRQNDRLRNYQIRQKFKNTRETLGEMLKPRIESSVYKKHPQNRKVDSYSLNKDCNKGEVKPVVHGKFYSAGQGETSITVSEILSRSSHSETQVGVSGGQIRRLEESWQKLEPVVECGDDSMTLTVRRRLALLLLLGPVNGQSFALSQLPLQCGYSVHRSRKDLSVDVQYGGCHVTQEGDSYVLPLLLRNTPIKMSCPVSPVKSQALGGLSSCCSSYGITVTIQGPSVTKELSINVRGEWTPLVVLAQHCGYTLNRRDAEIVFTAPFLACGITSKDGKYTFSLRLEEEIFMFTCLLSPAEEFQQADHSTTTSTKSLPEEPFSWVPPFYLAPPYYPHPTYYPKYPRAHLHDATAPLLPATTTFKSPHVTPLQPQQDQQNDHMQQIHTEEYYNVQASSGELQDSTQKLPDLQQKQETAADGVTHSPTSAAGLTPILQPHNYDFNPYYHYYHHPKIPLTNRPPKAPDPSPVSLVKSHNTVIPSVQAQTLPQLSQSSFDLYPNAELFHKYHELYAPQPDPYHNFPYYASLITEKTHLDDSQNINPLHSYISEVHEKPNTNSYMYNTHEKPVPERYPQRPTQFWSKNGDVRRNNEKKSAPVTPVVKLPLLLSTIRASDQHSIHASANHNAPLYSYLPYGHYWILHGPESLQSENHATPSTFTEAITPIPHQHTPNPIPQSTIYTTEQSSQPANSLNPEESTAYSGLSYYDGSWEEWFNLEAEYTPEFLYNPHYMSQLQLHDPIERPEVEADDEIQGHINANMYTPFASPFASGTESDFLCTVFPGCFDSLVKDCTLGEYFVFSLPECVEPRVTAHCSEVRDEACAVQRLTSNPLLYFVPLNGCGVRKQTVDLIIVYQVELQVVLLHEAHDFGYTLRTMVECRSSPGLLGAITLYILNPLPAVQYTEPAPVPVQLRIALDESFSRFHPEDHLPLSLIQGRPLFLELSLQQPPAFSVVLLVHYCLAYTLSPHVSWMLVYDGCPSWSDSQLLPSSDNPYILRIMVSSFLSLPSLSPSYMGKGEHRHVEDPEVYFFCFTEVCSAADGVCAVGCINSCKREL